MWSLAGGFELRRRYCRPGCGRTRHCWPRRCILSSRPGREREWKPGPGPPRTARHAPCQRTSFTPRRFRIQSFTQLTTNHPLTSSLHANTLRREAPRRESLLCRANAWAGVDRPACARVASAAGRAPRRASCNGWACGEGRCRCGCEIWGVDQPCRMPNLVTCTGPQVRYSGLWFHSLSGHGSRSP